MEYRNDEIKRGGTKDKDKNVLIQNLLKKAVLEKQQTIIRFRSHDLKKFLLPGASFDEIKDLNLSEKNLYKLTKDIALLTNLTYINVSNNRLTALPKSLQSCGNLAEINCSMNDIRDLDLNDFKNLLKLDCSNNKIISLKIDECISLEYLDIESNRISDLALPSHFSQNTKMFSLFMDNNFLKKIPDIYAGCIYISINSNQITENEDIASRFTKCVQLSLSSNHIYVAEENKSCLLNLLPPNVERVNFSGNTIKICEIPEATMDKLEIVFMPNNKMESFFFVGRAVRQLDISYNELKEVDLGGMNCLEILSLKRNMLHKIKLPESSKLSSINISYNHIKELSFVKNLPYLTRLDVECNQVQKISSGDFKGLSSLSFLNLSKNSLEKLSNVFSSNVPNLTELHLSNNPLSFLPDSLFQSESLKKLWMYNCPIDTQHLLDEKKTSKEMFF